MKPADSGSTAGFRLSLLLALVLGVAGAGVVGNLAPAAVAIGFIWAPALDRGSIVSGAARAAILVMSVSGFANVLGPVAGLPLTDLVSMLILGILAGAAIAHRVCAGAHRSKWWPDLSWGPALGPLVLLGAILISALRFGPLAAWAMNGDARNHVLVTAAIEVDDGWTTRLSYPAFANAVSATLGPGIGDGSMLTEIQSQAFLWLTLIVLTSLLLGLASGQGGYPFPQGRAAVGSLVGISPLLLGPLHEGFFPVSMVWLLSVAGILSALSVNSRMVTRIGYGALASIAVMATYPVAAPVLVLALIGCVLLDVGSLPARWIVAAVCVAGLWGALTYLGRTDLATTLSQPGALLIYSSLLPALLMASAFALAGIGDWSRQLPSVLAAAMGAIGLLLTVFWLNSIAPDSGNSYYAAKTILVGSGILLAPTLHVSPTAVAPSLPRGRAAAGASAVILILTYFPLFFASAPRLPPLKIAQGWWLPSVQEGGLVVRALSEDGRGIEWRVHESEVDRRINIWLAAGGSLGSLELNDDVFTWPYTADMTSVESICARLVAHPDMELYVRTKHQADFAIAACALEPDRLTVIGEG